VKSGAVESKDIRDLHGTMSAENAAVGIFITLEPPSAQMKTAAARSGVYSKEKYPKLQILTVEEILKNKIPSLPPRHRPYNTAQSFDHTERLTLPGITKEDDA
jgi:site-specific DNA-methyltransferase (adenine-specific)